MTPQMMSEKIVSYIGAMRNYEKAIKRLKKQVWRYRRDSLALEDAEELISRYACYKTADECINSCPEGTYPLHWHANRIMAPKHRGDAVWLIRKE